MLWATWGTVAYCHWIVAMAIIATSWKCTKTVKQKKENKFYFHEFSMTAQQNWLLFDDLTLCIVPIHLADFVLTVMVFVAKSWCGVMYLTLWKTSNMGASRPALMFDWIYGAMGCFWECSIQIRLTWLQGFSCGAECNIVNLTSTKTPISSKPTWITWVLIERQLKT